MVIMGIIRLWIRFPLIIFWTLSLWSLRLAIWPFVIRNPRLDYHIRRVIFRFYCHGLALLFGMRVKITGPVPKAPFYLVSNHLSYMDVYLLAYATGCTFVARGDLAHWPVIGAISKSLHVIFIDRERKKDTLRVNDIIGHQIENGDGVVVFAESRISPGRDVAPFKSAVLASAVELNLPVYYATISYKTNEGGLPANKAVAWWRPEPVFFHVFRLLKQPGFTATLHFGDEPMQSTDRKLLAQDLHLAVQKNFTPLE
jgi:1-acyl-sn-glycerol-3-phosphate acyltransferase